MSLREWFALTRERHGQSGEQSREAGAQITRRLQALLTRAPTPTQAEAPISMPAAQVNGSTDKAEINSVRTTSGMSPVVRD
ncbi:MAG: hypothetical protein WB762_07545 [Candidatus Sulfotelmatobacter sp.]